ncbi:MAG: T9SS type A sorting domain-containing protein [Tannerella sp.]|nr:T9SS type A sorting domain-containing protein [Tannerella sp.]
MEGNVIDATTLTTASIHTAGSSPDTKTDAILVLPNDDRFTLRTKGNYSELNIKQVATTIDTFYRQATFPSTSNADVYLSPSASATHPFASSLLRDYHSTKNGGHTNNIPAPPSETHASIFGVYGNYIYKTNNADIHTTISAANADNNDGVIEVGPSTTGQNHFHIYSGGTIKNFESCTTLNNFAINFTTGTNTPSFDIDAANPLWILNYGNNQSNNPCAADINFEDDGVDALAAAITSAGGTGELRVQARGDIAIKKAIAFTATTYNNNVRILSDEATIQTKGFEYTGGTGNVDLWANGAPGTCGGFVIIDGNVAITSTATTGLEAPLYDELDNNNSFLAGLSCGQITGMPAAYAASETNIQARIQSENDSVHVSGNFDYTGKNGALQVQGYEYVKIDGITTIDYLTGGAGTGDAAIQSTDSYVLFGDAISYKGGATTDLLIDGETGVTFHNGGLIDQTAAISPVNAGIQSNAGTILFEGAAFAFDVVNTDFVQVWAGKNIDIEAPLTYTDAAGTGTHVHFFANDSILTNANCGGAPVTFTVGNTTSPSTLTDWIAGGNIHTRDAVRFNYGQTNARVRTLTLKSLGGNIVTDRPVNIEYDSENRILFSAEIPCVEKNSPQNDPSNRNTSNGNILLNDSVKITRTNAAPGATDVLAKYNIRTAMVTIDDQATTSDVTTVKSHMGDIFLGYSTATDACASPAGSARSYDKNRFLYTAGSSNNGRLDILSGYDDQTNQNRDGGGNIYFTHVDATLGSGGNHPAKIAIPFSNEYSCGSAWSGGATDVRLRDLGDPANDVIRAQYEHAGIIGGVGACGTDDPTSYAPSQGAGSGGAASDTSLIYRGNNGSLLVDAGTRGNIIINRGAYLNFDQNTGNALFLTRNGNIDMRDPFDAESLRGGLLFLANSELADKLEVDPCSCEEERNNVYLQDFQYRSHADGGSVFIGADNNIKLQYGGLRTIGTGRDPFFSPTITAGYPCGTNFIHCDADTAMNHARPLILNFDRDASNVSITKGGFAAVASDLIDVYKAMIYTGGQGAGMSAVPDYGHLHGENVSGYGLYIKTQANKANWNKTDFEIDHQAEPTVGAACDTEECDDNSFLHQTARVTFHSDARIYAQNQKALITSPVLESYGFLDLNTSRNAGSKTNITIRTDSLIVHDSLIIDGPKTTFTTWSGLYRDMPILKLGHHRGTPPSEEAGCKGCYTHEKDTRKSGSTTPLETLNVTFRNDAGMPRLHTMVADHAIITFLTDSFDHTLGNPSLDTKFFTDTFKVRNHVELKTFDKTRSGHFELISEEQMLSKNYAGIYTRHLHMEPIGPTCSQFGYSQLWLEDPTLSVITSSIFGGFGWLHNDVYVEIDATLAPGFGSLGRAGNCYEQKAGILRTQNLRMDQGAHMRFSIGENHSDFSETFTCSNGSRYELGAYADLLDVEDLFLRGPVNIDVLIREEGLQLNGTTGRCFPILRYSSTQPTNLNNLQLSKSTLTPADHPSIDGTYNLALDFDEECKIVSLCIVPQHMPILNREIQIHIPDVAGVTSNIPPGFHYVRSHTDFAFSLNFATKLPLTVNTNRLIKGVLEDDLIGMLNENGEYEYVIRNVQEDIYLSIGPGYVGTASIEDGTAVWSHNNMLYIKVEKSDIASIYSIAGQLVKRIELPEGNTSIPLGRGVYVITLKDGAVHKVIIK